MTQAASDELFLTIAIPTYNNSTTLGRTIESCLRQTDLTDCEILVVNNSSTDGTNEVIAGYSEHADLRTVENEVTVTMFENHNICLEHARGRYVLFCHSDDRLDEEAVTILKAHLSRRNYPKRYICWGHSLYLDYSSMLKVYGYQTGQLFAGEKAATPFLSCGLTPSGTCYSKDLLDYGGFIKSTHRLSPSDSSTMVYLAFQGFRFEMIQQIIFFRTAPSTAVANLPILEELEAYCDTYSYLQNKMDDTTFKKIIKLAHSMLYPPLFFYYYIASFYPKDTAKGLLKCLLRRPWLIRGKVVQLALKDAVKNW